ncbi:hypothetical protein EV702DRAFT_1194990 [Suillus placidus]|uniref:Uncharacterized protein n=1 Tax=Suillus placidus TaxID=48579 RepID=A0A9P7D5A3_9AGAM|nr:hypothetical protein EV702DRAFT_1194990 [Suillus placidus]
MSTTSSEKSPEQSHETVNNRLTEVGAKDQRAYERARHQTKERREHAQVKERKERAAAGAPAPALKEGHANRAAKRASLELWDSNEPESHVLTGSGCSVNITPVPRNKYGFSKMALADFVLFKTKKQSKAQDADFEVVPPVRSVIALDDFGYDIEINEPWEFISLAPESPACKGLSYAQAAALTL